MKCVLYDYRYTVGMADERTDLNTLEMVPETLSDTVLSILQDLRLTLSVLNRSVGQHFSVNEVDLDCLDILSRHGPQAPGQLAQRMSLHLATMTGVLDRLERGGWVVRERSQRDRRRVTVRATSQSQRITDHYANASNELRALCADYPESELQAVIYFLRRASSMGVSRLRIEPLEQTIDPGRT